MSYGDLLGVMRCKDSLTATVMPPNQRLHPTRAASAVLAGELYTLGLSRKQREVETQARVLSDQRFC